MKKLFQLVIFVFFVIPVIAFTLMILTGIAANIAIWSAAL